MDQQQLKAKQEELERLRSQLAQLEREVAGGAQAPWRPTGYYTAYYATTGFMLGIFGAAASLLFNVIGAALVGKYPLELIRVYLTFPLGERALKIESGLALVIGCCLYLGTGMVLGVVFHLLLTRFASRAGLGQRLILAAVFSILLWLINFYGILNWLQPLLLGGNWIVEQVPWWVAALTHLSFGLTMAVVYPWGLYEPYRLQTEQS